LILPMVALPPVMVLTSQNTKIEFPLESVAVQASDLPDGTVRPEVVVEPKQLTALMAVAGRIVIVVVAVRVGCAVAIAVIVTMLLVGTIAGAVYRKLELKVPKVELPLSTPPASKVYKVLFRFKIVAVHCDVPFTTT